MNSSNNAAADIERGAHEAGAGPDSGPGLDTIAKDIADLKRDLAALMRHAKDAAVSGPGAKMRDVVDHLGDESRQLFGNIADQSKETVKAVERQIEERPLTSLLVAFAIGLLGGRLLSR